MTLFESIVLGVVQGLTEFLPVSSSGHLVVFQHLFGIQEQNITFDIFLHAATLLAVIIFFRRQLFALQLKQLTLLCIATIPAGLVGLLFKEHITSLFTSLQFVSATLFISALLNFFIDKNLQSERTVQTEKNQRKDMGDISIRDAVMIGTFQAFAVLPGISRSGSTLAGGMSRKLSRDAAFSFAFLLSIPIVLAATGLEAVSVWGSSSISVNWPVYLVGATTAFITGLLGLFILKYVITKAQIKFFGWYCLVLSISLWGAQLAGIL